MNQLLFEIVIAVLTFHRAKGMDGDVPMASSVVTYKDPNNRIPGPGFWTLARDIEMYGFAPSWDVPGKSASDEELISFWANQQQQTFSYFTPAPAREFQRWVHSHSPAL